MSLEILFAFAIHWLILFTAQYLVVESGQKYFYDGELSLLPLRVLGGSAISAVVLTVGWAVYDYGFTTMFTEAIGVTVIEVVVWFGLFVFLYQFHPPHAFPITVVLVLIIPGLTAMASDSLFRGEANTGGAVDEQQPAIELGPQPMPRGFGSGAVPITQGEEEDGATSGKDAATGRDDGASGPRN